MPGKSNAGEKMTLKIKYIKETREEIEEKAYSDLIEHFNNLAEAKGIKYRIKVKYNYPHIVKNVFFGLFEDYSVQIIYLNGIFFIESRGIDEDVLEEIRPILNKIPEVFEVELKRENA